MAQFLLDMEGHVVTWSPGASRIYLYSEDQAVGKHVSALYSIDENNGSEPQRELTRSAAEGHFGNEGWHARKDGTRFWANVITLALRDARGELQGFARGGYTLDSGNPYRLWFGLAPSWVDNAVIRDGINRHGLLREAEEEFAWTS